MKNKRLDNVMFSSLFENGLILINFLGFPNFEKN